MLTDWASKKLSQVTYGYLKIKCPTGECYGILAVYRICFATTLFHAVLSIFMLRLSSSRDPRASIQNGFWAWKLLAWAAFVGIAFFIPNEFFMGWGKYIDTPGAVIFLLLQIVILIDFAYSFSESLLQKWEETDDRAYIFALIFLTGAAYVASIVLTGFLYAWFGSGACKLNQFFISFNLILCFLISIVSISPPVQEANPKSGLAQAGMVSLYATYLVASAIASTPLDAGGETCNPLNHDSNTQTSSVVIGLIFTFLALAYSTSRTASQGISLGGAENTSLLADTADNSDSKYPEDDETDEVQYNYSFFHFTFAIAAMYVAMLLSNWNSLIVSKEDFVSVGKSMGTVWVKVVSR